MKVVPGPRPHDKKAEEKWGHRFRPRGRFETIITLINTYDYVISTFFFEREFWKANKRSLLCPDVRRRSLATRPLSTRTLLLREALFPPPPSELRVAFRRDKPENDPKTSGGLLSHRGRDGPRLREPFPMIIVRRSQSHWATEFPVAR